MPSRIRHCVECPECRTRYLVGFSPYDNGAYLVCAVSDSPDNYKLVCSCCRPPVCTRWSWSELKAYNIAMRAYARGYGSPAEVWVRQRDSDQQEAMPKSHSFGQQKRGIQ